MFIPLTLDLNFEMHFIRFYIILKQIFLFLRFCWFSKYNATFCLFIDLLFYFTPLIHTTFSFVLSTTLSLLIALRLVIWALFYWIFPHKQSAINFEWKSGADKRSEKLRTEFHSIHLPCFRCLFFIFFDEIINLFSLNLLKRQRQYKARKTQ